VFTVNHVTLGDSHRLLKESMVIAHNRRIVTVVFCAVYKYFYLLTYLLTYLIKLVITRAADIPS